MTTVGQRPPDIQMLLTHADFVRAMARSVLHGDADVDDVVQETWLTALRRPPGDARSLKGWLATVVRRRAHDHVRRHTRAAARDSKAAPLRSEDGPEAILQREEARRRLVNAVLALEEPYRTTLLLRYYHDLPIDEVASRQALPRETVRTRLRRGLAQLRLALDPQGSSARSQLAFGLAGLAGDPRISAQASASVGAGALLAMAACFAGIVWLGFFLYEGSAEESVVPREHAAAPGGGPELTPRARTPDAEPEAVAPAPPQKAGWFLEGHVVGADGQRLAGATIEAFDDRNAAVRTIVGRTLEDGRLEIDVAPIFVEGPTDRVVFRIRLDIDHPGHVPLRTWVPVTRAMRLAGRAGGRARIPVEIELSPAVATVTGRVERPSGFESSEITVVAYAINETEAPEREPTDVTTAAPDGSYRLRLDGSAAHDIIAFSSSPAGCLAPDAQRVASTGAEGLVLHVSPGASISGRVRCAGVPDHARLLVRAHPPRIATAPSWRERRPGLEWRKGLWRLEHPTAIRDTDGRYRISGLLPGVHALDMDHAVLLRGERRAVNPVEPLRDFRSTHTAPSVGADFDYQAELVLARFHADGKPLASAHIGVGEGKYFIMTRSDARGRVAWLREGTGEPHEHMFYNVSRGVRTVEITPWSQTEVTFKKHPKLTSLEIILEGDGIEQTEQFVLQAWKPGTGKKSGKKQWMRLAPDARRVGDRLFYEGVTPGVWRASLQVRSWYSADYAAPLVPLEFDLEVKRGVPNQVTLKLDPGGHLRIRDLRALQGRSGMPVPRGDGAVRIRHDEDAWRHHGTHFRVVDAQGRNYPLQSDAYEKEPRPFGSQSRRGEQRLRGTGSRRFYPALPPGEYALELWVDGKEDEPYRQPFTIEAGKITYLGE